MTLLVRALFLGYGTAATVAFLTVASAGPWLALLVAWLGGSFFSLILAGIGAWLCPDAPQRADGVVAAEPRGDPAAGSARGSVAAGRRGHSSGQIRGRPQTVRRQVASRGVPRPG